MKGNLLLFATSIVKLIDGWASFNVARKAVGVGISFTAAKVSSTYLFKNRVTYSRFRASPR